MRRMADMMRRCWTMGIAVVTLSLLWSLGMPAVTGADEPGAICVLKVVADGRLLSILVDTPQNFNVAVLIPKDKNVNVPILCESVSSLALAVANEEAHVTTFSAKVFTHDGISICVRGGLEVPVNGARGVTFADCL